MTTVTPIHLSGLVKTLLDNMPDAALIFDLSGEVQYANNKAQSIDSNICKRLIEKALVSQSLDTPMESGNYQAQLFKADNLIGLRLTKKKSHIVNTGFSLRQLVELLSESENIFQAAAEAIQQSLGWRWVAITRFAGDDKLEILSYLENHQPLDSFTYEIVGTPCQAVIESNQFTQFNDVVGAFPNYQPLQDAGIKNYAGLVFRDGNGEPIGHVMAMHDSDEVSFKQAREVIEIATLALSSHFKLCLANAQLNDIRLKANSDKLTGIGNRCSYESTLEKISTQYQKRAFDDWTIAIIDLDHLKPLNDTRGHKAGDQFIRLMAIELTRIGRQTDLSFRIGGDEFALIFSQNATPFIQSLMRRFDLALKRISALLDFKVDASIGFAALSETNGNTSQWVQLADQRMYQDKRSKRNVG